MSTRIDDPELKRLRALKALEMRMEGKNNRQIGEALGVSINTVSSILVWARTEGLTREYESQLIEGLVPLALKVYKEKLETDSDAFVAKDVIDKLFKLGDRYANREQAQENNTLAAYIADRKIFKANTRTAKEELDDIDIEVIKSDEQSANEEVFQPPVEPPVARIPVFGLAPLPAARPDTDPQPPDGEAIPGS